MLETNVIKMPPTLMTLVRSILEDHHEPTKMLLDKVKDLLRHAAVELPHTELLNKLGMSFQSLAMTMAMHMEKEEAVLFPMFQRLEDGFNTEKFCGGIENPIRVMESEHKDLDIAFERLHRLTSDFKIDAETPPIIADIYRSLRELEADLKIHSEKEEVELFPAAVARERAILKKSE